MCESPPRFPVLRARGIIAALTAAAIIWLVDSGAAQARGLPPGKIQVQRATPSPTPTPRDPFFRATPVPGRPARTSATPAPEPAGAARTRATPQATPTVPGAGSGSPAVTELNLPIQFEADGPYVAFTDLIEAVRRVDPDARGEWDGAVGVMRLNAGGRLFQSLISQPVMIVDGSYQPVRRSLKMRGGSVLVPHDSVKIVMASLGFIIAAGSSDLSAFRWYASAAAAAASAGRQEPDPGGAPRPPGAEPPPGPGQDPPPAASLPAGGLLAPVGERAVPDLGGVAQLEAMGIGLSWRQLVDFAHKDPPRRLTLICDPGALDFASSLDRILVRAGAGFEVTLVEVTGRRTDSALLTAIAASRPDLALDLTLDATGGDVIEIWAVYETLWAGESIAGAEGDAQRRLYLTHQFHNLALGAILRGELSQAFLDTPIYFELAPSFLLRRVDAPAVAVVLPAGLLGRDLRDQEPVARALAAGLIAYQAGMASAGGR